MTLACAKFVVITVNMETTGKVKAIMTMRSEDIKHARKPELYGNALNVCLRVIGFNRL